MIKEVFITDLSMNLILGSPRGVLHGLASSSSSDKLDGSSNLASSDKLDGSSNLASSPSPANQCSPDKLANSASSTNIASIQINDILLSALFSSLDSFTATKYLIDLHSHLLHFIPELTQASVRSHYFVLLEVLKSPEFIPRRTLPGGSVFIDVVLSVSSLSSNGILIRNKTYGEVFMDSMVSSLCMEVELKGGVRYKTPYMVCDSGLGGGYISGCNSSSCNSSSSSSSNGGSDDPTTNSLSNRHITIDVDEPQNRNILSFTTAETPLYFTLNSTNDLYTFKSAHPGRFKVIEFRIPVGPQAYDVECRATRGAHRFSLEEGAVYWRFTDTEFVQESIKLAVRSISEEVREARENVRVQFKTEEGETPVRVVGCSNRRQGKQKFWMRTTIQSKDYEFI